MTPLSPAESDEEQWQVARIGNELPPLGLVAEMATMDESATIKLSTAQYQSLFESAHEGILILDAVTLDIADANPAMMNLLVAAREEILGYKPWEVGLFADESSGRAALGQVKQTHLLHCQDMPLRLSNGEIREIELHCSLGSRGEHQLIQCTIRDLTEGKIAERQLKFQAHLLDMVAEAVIAIDLEAKITYWNRFAEQLYGWPAVEALGQSLPSLLVPSAKRGDATQILTQVGISQGEISTNDLVMQRRDGSRFHVAMTNSPIYNESGELSGFVSISKNVSEEKLAEINLRESEERYRLLLESVQDYAIYMLDLEGRVASWNSGAQRLKGYRADEIIGQHFSRFYTPEDADAGKPQRGLEIAARLGRSEQEGWRVCKSGEIFWANIVITAVRDEKGELRGFSKVTRDITERKLAQEKLERTNREILTIWESMTDALFALDRDWHITHVNEQTCRICRMTREELIGKGMWEVFPDAAKLKFGSEYARAIEEQVSVSFEEFYKPLNIWFEVHAYPSEIGLTVYFRDVTERKNSEQAIRQSEARFQSIVSNAPGMVYQFVLQPDGTVDIPFVNDGSRRLFEMTPDEVRNTASSFAQMIYPEDRAEWQVSIVQSAAALSPWDWEGRIQLPTGKVKWVQGAARPRRLPNGGTLWDSLLTDITERKQAEEERDRFFTLSLDMLCIVDGRGFFRRFNPAFEQTLGFSYVELTSHSLLHFVHPEDLASTRIALQDLWVNGATQQFVNRFRCQDGSYKWLSWRSTPYGGLNYAAARDITALKQAEDELQRANAELEHRVAQRTGELAHANEELHIEMRERQRAVEAQLESYSLLHAVIEGSTDSIFVKDLDGRYLMINSAGASYRGAKIEDVIGKTDADFFLPATAQKFVDSDKRILRLGTTQTYEQNIEGDNQRKTLLVTKGIHRSPQGEPIGIVGMARDITERQQQAEALHAAKEEADMANRAKSEFLSRMSHELRTPLNAILGFGQILEMHPLDSEERAAVTQILRGGWHLLDLVNEVLEISRVEAGHLELSLEPISLADVVMGACDLVRPLADQRTIRLEENEAQLCEQYVMADRQRLKQVLINLLSNAIKYNKVGGEVEVSCSKQPNGCIRIAVRDTGRGLSTNELEKLFTPFERLNATSSEIEGSGLGLALSQGLVEAMAGSIGVESIREQGSTFWVELPEAVAPIETLDELPPEIFEPQTSRQSEHNYTVLSVEDNLSNLWLLEAILTRRPEINLLAAMQGSVGLDLARQHVPDLILLDLNLPDMTGAQVLEQLRNSEATAEIPVIVISADATPLQIERLLRAGAQDYLTKPLNVAKFLRTLDETLALVHPRDEGQNPNKELPSDLPPVQSSTPITPLSILVVEDNPVNQQIVVHQLHGLGHKPSVVDNGTEAIEVWEKGEFSLILLDCHLPGLDGYEVAREIRRREDNARHIPIIALTATGSITDRNLCLSAGMDDYLSKPVNSKDLATVIARQTFMPSSATATESAKAEGTEEVLLRERWQELLTELDLELVRELVALFLEETPQLLAELQNAVENQNFKEVGQLAHTIKGSCATLGVMAMVESCRNIENLVTTQDMRNIKISLDNLFLELNSARVAFYDKLAL
ncbi:aerobic respiration control sensor protein ArcB [Abditibacteriota bacterium]|nr:aerobic respiration control sensor protein ArcB [Abditibacteriota bacterium]